jgi:hypothetical protein
MKIHPNKQSGIAQVWFVIIGGVLVLHVVLVPVFLWIAWEHRITVPPGAQVTLPAELTHPPQTGLWAAPVGPASPVAAPPVESKPDSLKIEPFGSEAVQLTIPAWSSLWESPTGEPDSWVWIVDVYRETICVRPALGPCKFFNVRPIARP